MLVESLVKRNELQERSAEMILEGAEKSAFQIGQVHQQSEQLHNVVKDILENMGEVRLDWHDEAVKSVEEIAKDLSDCRINFNDYLKNCFNKYNFIELLYVMNGRGQQIDNNVVHPDFINMIDNSGKGADRSTRSYCRHIIDGENSYISGIYVSSASNHLCLTVSVKFFCRGEAFILAADLNLEKFVLQS